jgi:hypothetical protein
MKRKLVNLMLSASLFLLLGCAGIKIVEDRKEFQKIKSVQDFSYDIYIPYFRYVTTPVDIANYCQGKDWRDVYVSGTVLGGIVSVATLGIVYPQSVEVICSK